MNTLICGNYGATNIGDELILKGILNSTVIPVKTGIQCNVIVLSNNPQETSKLHNVKSVYFLPCGFRSLLKSVFRLEILKTLKAYLKCDEFVFGGGGLMQDDNPKAILIWSVHIALALLLRKKVRILGNSVGPLNKKWSRGVVKFLFSKSDEITVRDEISKKLLEEIGVKKEVKVVKDFALSLVIPETIGNPVSKSNYAVLSLRDWLKGKEKQKFESEIVKMCNFLMQEKGYEIIAIPFEKLRDNDEQYLNSIKDKVQSKNLFHVQKYSSDVNKIFEIYSNANLVIGMRLHSIILAHKFNKPFIALSYSEKVSGFCQSIGQERDCFDVREWRF